MRHLVIALAPILLPGCLYEPLDGQPSVITRGTEPIYQYRSDGLIAATSCLSGAPAGYARTPSGCVVDSTFAGQVSHASDLTHPRAPGASYGQPVAAAAYDYIYGGPPGAGAGGAATGGAPPQRIDVAPGEGATGEGGATPPILPPQQQP